jgi:dihydrofolate reductase
VLWGSSTLTSTLLEHGLADEVMLVVYPALLGAGKRLFAEGTPGRSFELVSTQALPSGTIISNYRVAGPLKTGWFDDASTSVNTWNGVISRT